MELTITRKIFIMFFFCIALCNSDVIWCDVTAVCCCVMAILNPKIWIYSKSLQQQMPNLERVNVPDLKWRIFCLFFNTIKCPNVRKYKSALSHLKKASRYMCLIFFIFLQLWVIKTSKMVKLWTYNMDTYDNSQIFKSLWCANNNWVNV